MSEKIVKLNQKISNIIHLFFDGEVYNIKRDRLSEIYNDPKLNHDYDIISESEFKQLKKIIRLNKKENVRIVVQDSTIPSPESSESEKSVSSELSNEEYVSIQRKAFVDWVNRDFYKDVTEIDDEFRVYQRFVKGYLSLNTPYRGLLVYHGLGTGKTATAVTTAEGLSVNMEITTLLPASLESNFIDEVKKYGNEIYKRTIYDTNERLFVNDNNYIFVPEREIVRDKKLREVLYNDYKVSPEIIEKIHKRVQNRTKQTVDRGFWWISDNPERDKSEIKTISGRIIIDGKNTDVECDRLTTTDKIYIDIQSDFLIKLKYNFIHYNPFPKVKSSTIKEFIESKDDIIIEDDVETKTNNQKIVKRLETKLRNNAKNHHIDSPFYNEVIVIDEVHNLVRQIVNNSGPSRTFYNWILNAKDVKLICLSGTPIINKPCEIAVLYNMIRGITKRYNFTIKLDDITVNRNDIQTRLRKIFYDRKELRETFMLNSSPIYQLQVFERRGKLVVSFMEQSTNFDSVLNPDNNIVYTVKRNSHDFDDFIDVIYVGLHREFKPDSIVPSESTFKKLSDKERIDIIRGNRVEFDTDVKIDFNVFEPLFTINFDNKRVDLTDNNKFMSYFFDETREIPTRQRVLLKRMLMGLTSYYPIDKRDIVNIPEVVVPTDNPERYSDYTIAKTINIETCVMSQKQFEKYESAWMSERERNIQFNRKSMYSTDNFDYNINTRRVCNMVYDNDTFRTIDRKTDKSQYLSEKEREYTKLSDDLVINRGLQTYSPKFNRILNNIQKYIKDGISTGKILFYSDFRADAGSEIFERVLQANGYAKYDGKEMSTKRLRYTFITGEEKKRDIQKNLTAYNQSDNKRGEYIQIMIISSAGAEGISLYCVRQVHILEPYWNYVRINQVFGRAIRLKSHVELPPDERTVEEYLYLSVFPSGDNVKQIYESLTKIDTWINLLSGINPDLIDTERDLSENHGEVYDTLSRIVRVKTESITSKSVGVTIDQKIFDIMEDKNSIAEELTDVIKESSVDCVENTRDDVNIHKNCVQFDEKLQDEVAYFPGLSADRLSEVDRTQLKAKYSFFINPNIYVVSAVLDKRNIFVYYRLNDAQDRDIRYIKENGKELGTMDVDKSIFYKNTQDHELDREFEPELKIYREMYRLSDEIIDNITDHEIFPRLSEIVDSDIFGYKLKYSKTSRYYFYENTKKPIKRIYDFDLVENRNFNTTDLTSIVVYDKRFYESVKD